MLILAGRRLASMILIMIVISILLFLIFEADKLALAARVLGPYSPMEGRLQWLEDNGYNRPLIVRYFSWLYGFFTGDWKVSAQFNRPVLEFLAPRLANTAILGVCVFLITAVISLVLGVLSGINEGGPRDRIITVASVAHDLVPGIRLGDIPGRHLRLLARLAARLLVLLHRLSMASSSSCRCAVLVIYQFRLLHPHDARLDGRGHDLAICAHRRPQGPAVQPGGRHGMPCATRSSRPSP